MDAERDDWWVNNSVGMLEGGIDLVEATGSIGVLSFFTGFRPMVSAYILQEVICNCC